MFFKLIYLVEFHALREHHTRYLELLISQCHVGRAGVRRVVTLARVDWRAIARDH